MDDAAPSGSSAQSATAKYEDRIKRLRELHAKRVSSGENRNNLISFLYLLRIILVFRFLRVFVYWKLSSFIEH